MKDVINEVLENLAKRRPLFWSEADFQFEFAWELHTKLDGKAKIYLERRFEINMDSSDNANEKSNQSTTNKSLNKLYVDIWVEYDNKTYPIELKYTTKRCKIYDPENPKLAYVKRYCNKKWMFWTMFLTSILVLIMDIIIIFM